MCGIAGCFAGEASRIDPELFIDEMQEKLTRRGPDDKGVFISDNRMCSLVHTRLSILDLSAAGHQPMSSIDGRYRIVFNGEIYNYRELRNKFGSQRPEVGTRSVEATNQPSYLGPHRTHPVQQTRDVPTRQGAAVISQQSQVSTHWNSNSDTEVILRAYERWEQDCVYHLRGMFAFAIWDERKQELFLARDPFGIKPLYYYQTSDTFLFASEVRALLASGLVPRKLSHEAVVSYLQFGSVQDPHTIVDGVRSLLPGHCLIIKVSRNHLEVNEFAFTPTPNPQHQTPANRREAVIQLRSILEDSMRAHLVSDVPVAAFLSGGTDSSAIVGLMSRVSDEKLRTFNVSFDETEFSEQSYAHLVASNFGTEHENIRLSAGTLIRILPVALAAMDQPTMDGINTYVVSKAVRDAGAKVALSGVGGDELFAGYPSFRRAMQLDQLAAVPFAIRQFAAKPGRALLNGSSRRRKFWDMLESDCSPHAAYVLSRQLFSPAEIAALTRDQISDVGSRHEAVMKAQRSELGDCFQSKIQNRKSKTESDIVNEVSRLELSGYMTNTLLRDTDQMSMAHGLEVRVPFVDQEVVNYVVALPGEWKMNRGRLKPLLVDTVGDLLPEEIWRRPKMGFTLPFERWMRSALQTELDDTLSSRGTLDRLGANADEAKSVWHSFKKNPQRYPWSRPWALYVLVRWCQINEVTFS